MTKNLILALLLGLCMVSIPANAQQTLGSINGTILDPTGAAVVGATVTASDVDINVKREVKTQANGFFQIFNLPVGVYKVQATKDGFETTELKDIGVQEAHATTVNLSLTLGQASTSVEVTANPMLNSTDTTNGYTLDSEQIAETPLATGSFSQLAVLSPGVNAELLGGIDTNAGLGNQPIWANGQRDTSNTFQVNGVDASNIFNGKTSSSSSSQRYQFNIGQGSAIGGESQTGTSVYGSNGNSLPTPPPEFMQELRVNASMYDAQQGATSGAQVDANTKTGTNKFHGQLYSGFANNSLNADPFFFKQSALLAQQGVGSFPQSLANPALHRWSTGGTLGGPLLKDKLFFFVAYQHLYNSDQSTGLTQFNVPNVSFTDPATGTRDAASLTAAATAWNGKAISGFTFDPSGVVLAMFNAKLPNGQFMIPDPQSAGAYAYGVPNVTLIGTSTLVGDQANAALDYDVTKTDRLSFKYYYQNDPLTKPYGYSSQVGGFPANTYNGSQVGAIDNTITIGPRLNWEQRLGYIRMGTYSSYNQTVNNGAGSGPTFGMANVVPGAPALMPSISISEFAVPVSGTPSLRLGPNSTFVNTGYYQNRLNPSTNVIFTLGQHTIVAGGGYSYTQLNVQNNRNGLISGTATNLGTFLEGQLKTSSVLETLGPNGQNLANRYYRTNEGESYVQDKWQAMANLSITAGVRWDYHGGMTEKYGNFFNFDPSAYNVTGIDPGVGGAGFTVVNDGLVVAGNNPTAPTAGTSASTLSGRQWGISPRVGIAWSPKFGRDKLVIRGGAGMYYDRGELFTYLSPPAGGSVGGPFGVTQQSPLVSAVSGVDPTGLKYLPINTPLGSAGVLSSTTTPPSPSINPALQKTALQNQLNYMTGSTANFGLNCGGVGNLEDDCTQTPLYLGAYDKNNVLPYTVNYTFNIQWQPWSDVAVTIGYTGNRGRHAVIPIPFNLPQVATSSNPAQILGASPHSSGEATTYGYDVLNGNTSCGKYGDPCPIASEPWSTYDGGNVDFRAPYVGYSPYSALFETVGNSAYDSLETHIEKRMSHNVRVGASYTYGHALDEQSDIGLFFTGNDPTHLKNSYASADFDRRQVFSANFQALLPNAAKQHSLLSYFSNDWSMTGVAIVQSGEPFSLYEYNGAVASAQLGYYPSLVNPVLPILNPANPKSALTGNSGRFRGAGGNYIPAIDPNQIAIEYLTPGQNGVPTAAMGGTTDPVDVYETAYGTGDQRNIFRQGAQNRLDISIRKEFHVTERVHLRYAFNVFNLTNTTSMDVPQNGVQIAQHGSCANTYGTGGTNVLEDCTSGYEKYGMIVTSQADQGATSTGLGPAGGGTAGANLYQKPYTGGTAGKSIMVPTTVAVGTNGCAAANEIPTTSSCANNGANFGSVTGAIGSNRLITMDLHITF
jgi:Carboxypeptidase regulatory-like domain